MDSEFMVRLGQVIKNMRKNLGVTQEELGRRIDRPQASIARLESGQLGDTYFGFILDIAHALDMPAEALVAKVLGREFAPPERGKEENLQMLLRMKDQLAEIDPHAQRVVTELFQHLADWIKEVPKVPGSKK